MTADDGHGCRRNSPNPLSARARGNKRALSISSCRSCVPGTTLPGAFVATLDIQERIGAMRVVAPFG
jgi:hypothetical protein